MMGVSSSPRLFSAPEGGSYPVRGKSKKHHEVLVCHSMNMNV